MTMPEVICKTVAMQNNSQWPCSMCPIPLFTLVGGAGRASCIFNIFWTAWVLDPIANPYFGNPPASRLHPITRAGSVQLVLQELSIHWSVDFGKSPSAMVFPLKCSFDQWFHISVYSPEGPGMHIPCSNKTTCMPTTEELFDSSGTLTTCWLKRRRNSHDLGYGKFFTTYCQGER